MKFAMPSTPDLTLCLLNYRREKNIESIINALRLQRLPHKLFLWDNSGRGKAWAADWLISSSSNHACYPRWLMAARAETDFVAVMDDDLIPKDREVLSDLLTLFRENDIPGRIIGPFGVLLQHGRTYAECLHNLKSPSPLASADVIKGRFMLTRTCYLVPALPIGIENEFHDDIAVSALLADGRRAHHRAANRFRDRFADLPSPSAICDRKDHYHEREIARRRYFHY
jgi:hypothetical protein